MDDDMIAGAARETPGEATAAARRARGGARRAAGQVQAKIDKMAGRISQGVSKAADRTVALSERTAGQAQKVAETVEPFVRGRPFAATGVALGVGVVIGLLLAGRGPKIIYVKPRY